jgi:hypothetical protein
MTVVNGYAAGGDAPGGPEPIRSWALVLKPLIRGVLRGVRPSALTQPEPARWCCSRSRLGPFTSSPPALNFGTG